ncbi:MAG: TonB-dependent receptor, partial [Rhodothermales bacterium]|nr:TonB-dependent receptor [Rhodothermales bacterium]
MKSSMLLLVLSLSVSLGAGTALAQNAAVRGTVTDADGAALGGANVLVRAPAQTAMVAGTATDADGAYRIGGLAAGTYEVVARFVGFVDAVQTVTLAAGQTATVDLVLDADDVALNPVVVTASRRQEKALDAPASISVVTARELEADPVPSPTVSLRNMPGVDIAQVGVDRYQVTLRGFNEVFVSRLYVLTDYRQAVTPSLGVNQFGSMPISPLDLAQIEVVRGPGSALYGPGVEQGVVHFITKDPLTFPGTSAMIGGGERSTFQASLRHAGILNDRVGYKVVGYYSRAEDWPFDPDDAADLDILCNIARDADGNASRCARDAAGTVIEAIELAERDDETWKGYGAGTLQYRFAPTTVLTLFGGYSALKQINQANTGENQIDNFGTLFGQARLQAGNFFAQAYLNRNDAGDTFVIRSGADIIDESTQFTAQAQYDLDFAGGRQGFIVGGDYKVTTPKTGGTIHGRNEEDDQLVEAGVYLQSETHVTPQLDLVLTGRLDRDNVIEKVQLSPRAALVFKPTPAHSLRATYNRAFTTPAGVNLFLDLVVAPPAANGGLFGIRAVGARDPFTFDDANLVSLVPSLAGALAPLG